MQKSTTGLLNRQKDTPSALIEKLKQLRELNNSVSTKVLNPYLSLFYKLMIDNAYDQDAKAKMLIDFSKKHVINLFDFVAICCRFLDSAQLKLVLEAKANSDIEDGNLQVLALIGLTSPKAPRVIQAFIDRTGDVQTAAYAAAYIATALTN